MQNLHLKEYRDFLCPGDIYEWEAPLDDELLALLGDANLHETDFPAGHVLNARDLNHELVVMPMYARTPLMAARRNHITTYESELGQMKKEALS